METVKAGHQELGLEHIDWLAEALTPHTGTRRRLAKRTRQKIGALLEKSDDPRACFVAVNALYKALQLEPARWRRELIKDELPAVGLVPNEGVCVVFASNPNGGWLVEAADGRKRVDTWPEGSAFAAARIGEALDDAVTARRLFGDVFDSDRHWLVQTAFASTVGSILALATSLYSMQVYDRVISQGGIPTLVVLTIGVGISILLEFVIKIARSFIINDAVRDIDLNFANGVFERMLRVRLDQFPAHVGTLAAQVRGFEVIRGFKVAVTQYMVADAPFAALFLFVIFLLGGTSMALVPAVALVVAVAIGWSFKRAIRAHSAQETLVGNRRQGLLVEAIHGAETLRSTGGTWRMLGRWNDLSHRTVDETHQVKRLSDLSSFFSGAIQQISYVALVATGAWLATSGSKLTVGSIIACSIISGRVLTPINMLPGLMVQWGHAKVALENLEKLFALQCENHDVEVPLTPSRVSGNITISTVEFAYPGQPHPMELPALSVRAGERVAVVGAIGAGKSTLLKIVAGLCKPSRGSVLLDGIDLFQIAPERRCEIIGYLPQRSRLFSGTLRDNLLLGFSGVGDEKLLEVAEVTGLADLIRARPEGLDMPIPEGGEGLSGGQTQLVAITRLLLAEPNVWLLDEPTSSMDDASEARCIEAIKKNVSADQTLIVVTHKMRLLELVDRIVVLTPRGVALDGERDAVLRHLRGEGSAERHGSGEGQREVPQKNAQVAVARGELPREGGRGYAS